MNKKTYQTPSVLTFEIATMQMLCGSITDVDGGDSGIGYGGGGSGGARAPLFDDFDDLPDLPTGFGE